MPRKSDTERIAISVWISKEKAEMANKLAKKASVSRSLLLSNLVEMGIDGLERSNRVGVYSVAILMRNIEDGIRAAVEQLRDEPKEVLALFQE